MKAQPINDRKAAMKIFKAHKKKMEAYARINDCSETFVDAMMDTMALALDKAFDTNCFMRELCK